MAHGEVLMGMKVEICKREKMAIEKDIESFENSEEKRDDLLSTLLHLR